MHVKNHKAYWRWYQYIKSNASDKAVGIKAKIKVDVRFWDTQWFEGLIAPDKN